MRFYYDNIDYETAVASATQHELVVAVYRCSWLKEGLPRPYLFRQRGDDKPYKYPYRREVTEEEKSSNDWKIGLRQMTLQDVLRIRNMYSAEIVISRADWLVEFIDINKSGERRFKPHGELKFLKTSPTGFSFISSRYYIDSNAGTGEYRTARLFTPGDILADDWMIITPAYTPAYGYLLFDETIESARGIL
jgi:hypothetical protein